MTRVTIQEAESNLARLIEEVENGGEVLISRSDKAVVRLVVVEPEVPRPKRKPGRMQGLIKVGDEIFDPLPEDELRLWEGHDDWDFFSTPPR